MLSSRVVNKESCDLADCAKAASQSWGGELSKFACVESRALQCTVCVHAGCKRLPEQDKVSCVQRPGKLGGAGATIDFQSL